MTQPMTVMFPLVGTSPNEVPSSGISMPLRPMLKLSTDHTEWEAAASFGRWWHDPASGQVVLSAAAARLLDVHARHHYRLEDCFVQAVADDVAGPIRLLSGKCRVASGDHEFRVIDAVAGMRWLRATVLPADPAHPSLVSGILLDITQLKHAAVRERLGFELTEYLVGTHALGDAVVSVIQLICKNLGWEWGAYWALEQAPQGQPHLACRHFWHQPSFDVGTFSGSSSTLTMMPGQGLVGGVWQTGQAAWVDDVSTDPRFLRRTSARDCGLWSGYIFPVTYVSDDGEQHRPGVLEFYSSLSRQPDAQLPKLSSTIGALMAQTAQRLEQEAVIRRLAQVDGLTGLANRSHFYAQLDQACVTSSKLGASVGLMFIDLDRFKPINDAFGHEAGNVVLCEFAQRLQALAPEGAIAGRLGGDEFALMAPNQSAEALAALAEQVLDAARTPFSYEGVALTVSASIGISRFPDNGSTSPELLRSADAAMYRVKQNGRNGYDVFSTRNRNALVRQQASLAQRLTIETELHQALQGHELFLVYQPIFDLTTERMHAVEALVRWQRADGTLVSPDTFIPIAEQSHLIVEIGQWVVAQACRDVATLRRAGFDGLKVHVNMAASEFTNGALPEVLSKLVDATDMDPGCLSLELTEGMLMKWPEQVIPVMHALRRRGFEISLDDFGMGHSSLSLLKTLPISSMKIDRSFVRDLSLQSRDQAIAQTIVDLGRHMCLDVIAEGIETDAQLAILTQLGCNLIQGFLLGRPMALADLLVQFPSGRFASADRPSLVSPD